jgi:hypothetical protein
MSKDRDEFIAVLVREFPDKPMAEVIRVAKLLMRHARTYGRIQEMECNGHPAQSNPYMPIETLNKLQARHEAYCEKEGKRMEGLLTRAGAALGCEVKFTGDPRGYTVRLMLPSKRYNTWGGAEDGWGVPNS